MAERMQTLMSPWAQVLAMNQARPEQNMTPLPPGGIPAKETSLQEQMMKKAAGMPATDFSMSVPNISAGDREMEDLIKRKIKEREGGIEGMQKQIENLNAKKYGAADVDLSPLSGLVDSWTGSNLTASYKAPGTKLKDEDTKKKLAEAINKQQGEITDDMIALLKEKSQAKFAMSMGRQERFNQAQDLRKEDTLRKDITKVADEYQGTQGQLKQAEDAVKTGDTRSIKMFISSIARNIGEQKGALSDGDVARSLPPDIATDIASLEAYLGTKSKISPELQNALLNLITGAKAKSDALYQQSIQRRRDAYSSGAYAPLMQEGKVGDVIFKGALPPQTSVAPPQAPGTSAVMSPQDWLKSKRAKQ